MAPMPSKQQVMPIDPTQVVRDPARLAALRRTALLDTASEAAFDRLTRLVTIILNVPVALVSLVDEDRQFFKSCVGLPEPWASRRETPLSHSFCQHTITSNEPLLIADARVHPLVSDNLAIPDLNVIAYAGMPLILPDGSAIGSLCAIDTRPRWWTADEVNILRDLALSAVTEVELRIATLEAQARANEAERERWEKLALLESTGEGIFGVDLDGRCTFINRTAAHMLGYAPDDVRGRNMHALIQPSRPDGTPFPYKDSSLYRSIHGGEGERVEDDVVWRRDGTPLSVDYSASPVIVNEQIVGGVVTINDISKRKRAEQQLTFLSEASAVLAASLDYEATLASVARLAVPTFADWCLIDLVDDEGVVQRLEVACSDPAKAGLANAIKRFAPRPGWQTPQARVLQSGSSILLPRLSPDVLERMAHDAEHYAAIRTAEITSMLVVPLRTHNRTVGALTFAVTEAHRRYQPSDVFFAEELARRAALAIDNARLYREARRALQARDAILSIVSHDLQNPLSGIKGYAGLLRRRIATGRAVEPATLLRNLDKIDVATTNMSMLIDELLDLSHLQAGQPLALRLGAVDLVALARQVCTDQQHTTSRHVLRVASEADELAGLYDVARIERMLTNLVANAIKYSPGGGAVVVRARRVDQPDGAWAVLDVQDHGLGIPAHDLARIFHRFQRAANVGQISGTGIGLASALYVVEQHGGTITVESQEGVGSVFSVRLPLSAP